MSSCWLCCWVWSSGASVRRTASAARDPCPLAGSLHCLPPRLPKSVGNTVEMCCLLRKSVVVFIVLSLMLKHRLEALGLPSGVGVGFWAALKSSWQLFSIEQPSLTSLTSFTIEKDNWLKNPHEIKIDRGECFYQVLARWQS